MNLALVEDNIRTRSRIAKLLELSLPDVRITQLANLEMGLLFATRAKQDYWLIDLGLPDGSGIDLIRAVRKQHAAANILVISVFGDVDNIVNSIQAGADGYLLKDAIDKDLVQAIHAISLGGTPLSPMIASRLLERMLPARAAAAASVNTSINTQNQQANVQPIEALTDREMEILGLLARGYKYVEVGQLMDISITTVQSHVRRIYFKLAVNSRSEAVFEAKAMGLLSS
jgi:DNA-binding NarL/FixJ family response regulator